LGDLRTLAGLLEELSKATSKQFTANSFESRLRIQKTIYLLKALGVPEAMEYSYGNYVRGPYSPDLAKDYYSLMQLRVTSRRVSIPAGKMEFIKRCVARGNEFLEAVSTLRSISRANPSSTENEIMNHARNLKPHLDPHFSEAWRLLEVRHLVSQ
jgi:uncharacterized protein YwgA